MLQIEYRTIKCMADMALLYLKSAIDLLLKGEKGRDLPKNGVHQRTSGGRVGESRGGRGREADEKRRS